MDIGDGRLRPVQFYIDMRLVYSLLVIPAWIGLRLYTLWEIGLFTNLENVNYQDVGLYTWWADSTLQSQQMPSDTSWQYPPAAIFMFLLPRLFVTPYPLTFIALMLVFDALAAFALVRLARRTGNWLGVCFWLVAISWTGGITLLRFDLVPTALAVVALGLLVVSRARHAFGFVVGLAIAVKAWPVLVLLGTRTIGELIRALVGVVLVLLTTCLAAFALFGNPFAFVAHHAGRGLEIEAITATPWLVHQFITGEPFATAARNGCIEIDDATADLVARLLFGAMAALGLFLAAWWVLARDAWRKPELSIDAVFAATLLYVCFSEVLSPQYFIWLIGIAAVRFSIAGPKLPWRFALSFGVLIVLNRLLWDNWVDLLENGRFGIAVLIVRNAGLVAMAAYFLVRLARSVRWTLPLGRRTEAPAADVAEDATG